jgi:hypothetical protein
VSDTVFPVISVNWRAGAASPTAGLSTAAEAVWLPIGRLVLPVGAGLTGGVLAHDVAISNSDKPNEAIAISLFTLTSHNNYLLKLCPISSFNIKTGIISSRLTIKIMRSTVIFRNAISGQT